MIINNNNNDRNLTKNLNPKPETRNLVMSPGEDVIQHAVRIPAVNPLPGGRPLL